MKNVFREPVDERKRNVLCRLLLFVLRRKSFDVKVLRRRMEKGSPTLNTHTIYPFQHIKNRLLAELVRTLDELRLIELSSLLLSRFCSGTHFTALLTYRVYYLHLHLWWQKRRAEAWWDENEINNLKTRIETQSICRRRLSQTTSRFSLVCSISSWLPLVPQIFATLSSMKIFVKFMINISSRQTMRRRRPAPQGIKIEFGLITLSAKCCFANFQLSSECCCFSASREGGGCRQFYWFYDDENELLYNMLSHQLKNFNFSACQPTWYDNDECWRRDDTLNFCKSLS